MTEQKKKITESADFIISKSPFEGKVDTALVTYRDPVFLKELKMHGDIPYREIPPEFEGSEKNHKGNLIFASAGKKNLYVLNGHFNYFEGYKMREAAHPIYVLRELGVKNIILIEEAGHLNPRFAVGNVALIYDHINFMGDNPLIGENDNTIGPRFPDMSNAYDDKLYAKVEKYLIDKKFGYYASVLIGVTGPETETEAECRFYREIGSDILGYSIVPENLAAVHAGMKCVGFAMLSRELVADRLVEIDEAEKKENRVKAEKLFAPFLKDIINLF